MTGIEPRISIVTLLVRDMARSYRFYAQGLGLPTSGTETSRWLGFRLNGLCLALYPYGEVGSEHLPRRLDVESALNPAIVPGIGLAYNTREKNQVDEVLRLAARSGGKIEKLPEDTFWGGYSGYFSDPDGHLWEVAWAESWEFKEDGSLVVD